MSLFRMPPGHIFGLICITLLVFASTGVNAEKKNLTVFTPEVDAALHKAPDWLWDTFAALGILFGTIFAFVGSRMLRTTAFLFGSFVGALIAAVILAIIGNVSSEIWLPVVISTAILCGIIVACIIKLARFVMLISLGVTIAGVFAQYALSYIEDLPAWVLYTLIAIGVLLSAFLAWKSYEFAMVFATSFFGGFIVLVSTARFTRGPISLAGMWMDPEFMQACVDMTCWGPFIAGAGVCILGLAYQLNKYRWKSKKVTDKRTKRELEAAEKARKKEKDRFEARVAEIRRLADAEIAAATEESRRAVETATRERETLLRQTRQIEEAQERLRQERIRIDQEAQVVEAEYVRFNGNLPVAAAVPIPSRLQLSIPGRSASRPVSDRPQDNEGWGGGPRPWNRCPTHNVTYDVCGCTNPKSKEQVMHELETLRSERQRFEQEQSELAQRNAELRTRLKIAEEAAVSAALQVSVAERRAAEQVVRSSEIESRLNSERQELNRLLSEAEKEKEDIIQQLRLIQQTRPTLVPEDVGPGVVPPTDDVESIAALDEEELRLRDLIAQAESLEDTLRQEMTMLDNEPEAVLLTTASTAVVSSKTAPKKAPAIPKEKGEYTGSTPTATKGPKPARPPRPPRTTVPPPRPPRKNPPQPKAVPATSSASALPQPQTENRFASKWTTVERAHPVSQSTAERANISTPASRSAPTRVETEAQEEGEFEPVRDLFNDLGKGFQLVLEGIVFVIATIGQGIGMCLDVYRDAQFDRQHNQIRHDSRKSGPYKASTVRERFSSARPTE